MYYARAGTSANKQKDKDHALKPAFAANVAQHKNYKSGELGRRSTIAFVGTDSIKSPGKRRIPTIERELWDVFTYYTIQSDPLYPGHMRTTAFFNFCKDCGLLEPRLGKGEIQVAIVAQTKQYTISPKKNRFQASAPSGLSMESLGKLGNKNKAGTRRNPTSLTFLDFMEVLRALAPRLYPDTDPAGAFKRLLLEDVLFLASRRKPKFDRLVLSDPETHELIDSQFERGLHNIFMYYCKISDRRRGADASHATKVKSQQAGPTAQVALTSRRSSVLIAAGKYHTSFSEFVSFIRDFKIVGGQGRQALLTVSECSELYLALAPSFSNREEAIPDIDELSFRKIITYMAIQWTAAMAGEVSRVNRVKALLLHMWKSLNTQEDAIGEAVNQGKRMDVTKCRGGDLNICGSSDFNATFLAMWQQDGYCDYLHLGDTSDKSARLMIKKLLRSPVSPNSLPEFTASMIGGTDSPGDDGDLRDGEGGDGADGRRGTGHSETTSKSLRFSAQADEMSVSDVATSTVDSTKPIEINLKASDLRKLFAERDDIRELIAIGLDVTEQEAIQEELEEQYRQSQIAKQKGDFDVVDELEELTDSDSYDDEDPPAPKTRPPLAKPRAPKPPTPSYVTNKLRASVSGPPPPPPPPPVQSGGPPPPPPSIATRPPTPPPPSAGGGGGDSEEEGTEEEEEEEELGRTEL